MPGVRPASPGRRLAPLVLTVAVGAACGAPTRVTLPDGPGTPLADPTTLLGAATVACRAVDAITAEAAMSGRVGGRRVRGRLLFGVDRIGRLRLEAVAPFGAPLLVLAASERGTTLVLPRDGRVLEGAALADVLDALVGLRLGGVDLHAVLTGCPPGGARAAGGRRYPRRLSAIDLDAGGTVWVREEPTGARLVVREAGGLTVEYADFALGVATRLTIVAAGQGGLAASELVLRLSQVERGVPLDDRAFEVEVPAGSTPLTLDELRQSGPLSGSGRPSGS